MQSSTFALVFARLALLSCVLLSFVDFQPFLWKDI